MNFRTLFFRLPAILALLLCFGIDSFGLQERQVRISPILIKWHTSSQMFRAYFDVTNDSSEDVDLTSIIIFKTGKFRRWRGAHLPKVKAKQSGSFKISFVPGIMLKNEYFSITVNIYGKNYIGLIDYSSRYVKISSRRVVAEGKTQIELVEAASKAVAAAPKAVAAAPKAAEPLPESVKTPSKTAPVPPKTAPVPPQPSKRIITLGPAKERLQLLATEQFQNAVLEPVSPAEKKVLAEPVEPPVIEPPSPPELLTVTPGKNQNQLTWEPVEDATAYHLYWGKSAGLTRENSIKIENVTSGHVHSDLNEAADFYYILTAVKDGLESEPSTEVMGKPILEPPSPPLMLAVTPGKYQNQLTWTPVEDATAYHLYWGNSPELTLENGTKIENVTSGYIHSDLNEPVDFYYVVTAVKDGLESEASVEVTGKPIILPQGTPQLTIIGGDKSLLLSWTMVKGATQYELYWGTSPKVVPTEDNKMVIQGNSFEHTGLENDRAYYYIIAAANSSGTSNLSAVSTGLPKAPPVIEASVSELMEGVQLDDFRLVKTDAALLVPISDVNLEQEATLKRAEDLKALDISSRDKLIALYIAEGKSESVAKALSGQLSKEPENLNLSLSLSKVYHEQGDIKAALKVLNSSLNRISLSARVALNQELKTSVKKGESTLTTKSEEAYLADEFSRLGVSLLEKKKYIEALSAFQSLYSLSQDYPMVKYYLGLSRHGLKQYNQAKQLFVEQAQADLKKQQMINDLTALTSVLATTLERLTIKNTKNQFVKLQEQENTPAEAKAIAEQIAILDSLLVEAEKRWLAGLPDLKIDMSDDFDRKEIQAGQEILFAFTAMNLGKVKSEPFRVYYQLMHEQGMTFDIPSFDRFLALESKLAKESEKSTHSWERKIIVPSAVVPGKYQLVANVEQTEGKGEATFDNNKAQSALAISVIPPIADLKIGFVEKMEPMPIKAGQKIDLDLIVTNQGFKDSPPFEVDYFLGKEGGESINLNVSDKKAAVPKANKSITWTKRLIVPADISEGQYQFQVSIRMAAKAPEHDSKNNTVASAFNLNYTPSYTDLALTIEQEPATQAFLGGQTFSIQLKIENNGNMPSSDGKVVYRLINENGEETLLKGEDHFSALKKDQPPLIFSRKFKLSEDFPKGVYQLAVALELEDDNLEKNLENNRIASENRLSIVPSFSDLALSFSMEPVTQALIGGQKFSAQLKIETEGNTESSDGKVIYQLQDEKGGMITLEEEDSFPELKKDQLPITLDREFQLPEKLPRGTYQLLAKLQLDEKRLEINLENNSAVSKNQLNIVPSYSNLSLALEVTDQEQPLTPGESITIKARLTNSGNRDTGEIEVTYYLKTRTGQDYEIRETDQFENMGPGSEKEFEKIILIPDDIADGLYQIAAEAKLDDAEFEENLQNNGDQSAYLFSYEKPEPAAPIVQAAEEVQPVIEEEKKTHWLRHASAITLAVGATWQALEEDKKFQSAKDQESVLQRQYSSSQTASQVAVINSELENTRDQQKLYIQNTNFWGTLALVGVGWEVYNIFFWSPDDAAVAQADDSGPLLSNKWMHVSAISVTLLAAWQSQLEIKKYNELSTENDNLNIQYASAGTAEEVATISNKIASNETEMKSHIANANIFDGVTLAALGLESYLLWKAFLGSGTESAGLRFQNSDGIQLKPYFAYKKVGLNLNYNW